MRRLLLFACFCVLSWWPMMALHELGHVIGALATGGAVQSVGLAPWRFSQTLVSPNPAPAIVVWAGLVLGIAMPLLAWVAATMASRRLRNAAMFFAGFCLIANGGYIAGGSIGKIGDVKVMLDHGTPLWVTIVFGLLSMGVGLWMWHRLGQPTHPR